MKSTIVGLFFLLMLSCGGYAQTTDKYMQKMKTDLKLTDKQVADVTPLLVEKKQLRQQIAKINRKDNVVLFDSLVVKYNGLDDKIEALFTAEQKKTLKALKGDVQ